MSSELKRGLIRAVVYGVPAGLLASVTVHIFDIGEEGSWSRFAVLWAFMIVTLYLVFRPYVRRQSGREHRDEGTPGAGQMGDEKQ